MKREQMNEKQVEYISRLADLMPDVERIKFFADNHVWYYRPGCYLSPRYETLSDEFKLLFFGIAADDLTFDLTEFRQPQPPRLNDEQVKELTRLARKNPDKTHVAIDGTRRVDLYEYEPMQGLRVWVKLEGKYKTIRGKKLRRAFAGWHWGRCCFDLRPYRQPQYKVIDGNNEITGTINNKPVTMYVTCEVDCLCGDTMYKCQNELAQAIADKLNS